MNKDKLLDVVVFVLGLVLFSGIAWLVVGADTVIGLLIIWAIIWIAAAIVTVGRHLVANLRDHNEE
jgi:hypothetical protein